MTDFRWRPMEAQDIDGVVAVAATAFPDHFEGRACFEERFALFPQGCFALTRPRTPSDDGTVDGAATADLVPGAEEMKGYLIAYPWTHGEIPPLNSLLGALPQRQDVLYLHDLALHPDVRGQGHPRPIVAHLAALARTLDFPAITLVSVNASVPFWQAMGFEPTDADPAITRKLESYGDGSRYMARPI
jgi:GNAT superfamily N-acetyltransferase